MERIPAETLRPESERYTRCCRATSVHTGGYNNSQSKQRGLEGRALGRPLRDLLSCRGTWELHMLLMVLMSPAKDRDFGYCPEGVGEPAGEFRHTVIFVCQKSGTCPSP